MVLSHWLRLTSYDLGTNLADHVNLINQKVVIFRFHGLFHIKLAILSEKTGLSHFAFKTINRNKKRNKNHIEKLAKIMNVTIKYS